MDRTWIRRPVMACGVVALAFVLLVMMPVWLPLLALIDLVRRRWRFPLLRFVAFGTMWAWLETGGLFAAATLFVVGQAKNQTLNYALQAWWTRNVVRALRVTVGVQIEVEGFSELGPGPFVAFCRHASLADSVMSAWVLTEHAHLKPRYVLKKELKMDPCLDVVGHRLPNYFIDRSSANIASELQGIEQMAEGLAGNDVAVIFPEGSRANPQKRDRAIERLQNRSPHRAARLQKLQYLLPPKPAGASALLAAVPNANVITMWHSGFDGLDTFKGIVHHLARRAIRVHVKIIEHHRSTVASGEAFVDWLDAQWLAMDEAVSRQFEKIVPVRKGEVHG
jgi:1-acyl-sn-glycerol-3-phosphate acyltransferase